MTKLILLAPFAMLCTVAAHADDAILNANNLVNVDFIEHHLNYHEDYYGMQLDSEHGTQPGLSVTTTSQSYFYGIADVYAKAWLQYSQGKTNYVGGYFNNLNQYVPVNLRTDDKTFDAGYRLGKGFTFASREAQLTPYLSYNYHRWIRDVHNGVSNGVTVLGNNETYSNNSLTFGVLGQLALGDSLVLSVDGNYGETFGSHMDSDDNQAIYNLGTAHVSNIAVGLDYAVTRQLHVNGSYSVTRYRYGTSGLAWDGSWEPNSNTRENVVSVGVGYAL